MLYDVDRVEPAASTPALELLRAALHEHGTPYAEGLDAVCLTVGEPSAADRARAVKLAAAGPPSELGGLWSVRGAPYRSR